MFGGKHEQYGHCNERVVSFLGDEVGTAELLEWAEARDRPIGEDDFQDYEGKLDRDVNEFSRHLHSFLTNRTSGTAHSMEVVPEANDTEVSGFQMI